MHSRNDILGYALLALVGLAGYVGAPWWFALLAAAGLALEDTARLCRLQRSAPMAPSTKGITYVATGIAANIVLAAATYWVGAVAGALL